MGRKSHRKKKSIKVQRRWTFGIHHEVAPWYLGFCAHISSGTPQGLLRDCKSTEKVTQNSGDFLELSRPSAARHEVLLHDPADWDDVVPEMLVLPKINNSTPITARLYVSALSTDGRSLQGPSISALSSCAERDVNEPTTSSPILYPPIGSEPPISPSEYLRSHCPLCFGGMSETGENKL